MFALWPYPTNPSHICAIVCTPSFLVSSSHRRIHYPAQQGIKRGESISQSTSYPFRRSHQAIPDRRAHFACHGYQYSSYLAVTLHTGYIDFRQSIFQSRRGIDNRGCARLGVSIIILIFARFTFPLRFSISTPALALLVLIIKISTIPGSSSEAYSKNRNRRVS